MDQEQQDKLRAPFEPHQIGKLPATQKRPELDYVGHAAVTDRLLAVDPEWTWEPVAFDANGVPIVANGGLWIKLTVAGVTRYGYGDETQGQGMKEMIGDAIRNAAMRFGVALDLWSKQPLLDAAPERSGRKEVEAPAPGAPVTVPQGWMELREAFNNDFYPHPWQEWWIEAATAFYSLRVETTASFSDVLKMVGAKASDFWQRMLKVWQAIPVSDLGPTRSDVRKAFSDHFDGAVLFGPHVSMDAAEAEDYPTYTMYLAGDLRPAVQVAADEDSGVESGPSDTAPSEEPGDRGVTADAGLGEDVPASSAPDTDEGGTGSVPAPLAEPPSSFQVPEGVAEK